MARWDVDELESRLLYEETEHEAIETKIRKISGNPHIELCGHGGGDGIVEGHLETDGERWPCGDVGPMDVRGMARIASLFEEGSVLAFCDSYSEFHRLETEAGGTVQVKWFTAASAYESLPWDAVAAYEADLACKEAGQR